MASRLFGKHLHENSQDFILCGSADFPQLFHQPALVDCANLIQDNLPGFPFKLTIHPAWVISTFGCQGSYDNRRDVTFISSGEMTRQGRVF